MCAKKGHDRCSSGRREACDRGISKTRRVNSLLGTNGFLPRTGTCSWSGAKAIPSRRKRGNILLRMISEMFDSKLCSGRLKITKKLILSVFVTILSVGIGLGVGVVYFFELYTLKGFSRFYLQLENIDMEAEECTIDMPSLVQDFFRPPVDCSMCSDVHQVDRISDVDPKDFEELYAYSGRPVVVLDGQRNWTAPDVFSFLFLRSIYFDDSPSLLNFERDCQFFPYKTEFLNLKQVFNMSQQRYNHKWYIGWSNCDSYAADILRQHYQRPYFLPELSEVSKTDWIFMGTPGHGAHLHIDHVGKPSWQAQIRGRKQWTLEPPPECYFECSSMEVIVNPGEIFVLDTNSWYHGTFILDEEISITIGAEYD